MILHVALRDEWQDAVDRGGPYDRSTIGRSLEEEGFIHCSFPEQLAPTLARFYGDRDDVVVLQIDPELTGAELRVEDLYDSGTVFPHLYGPVPLAAVVDVRRVGSEHR
ncbi:MAG: DUF952 domain-containing protein [Microthrixaceae bacterium]